MYKNKIVGLLIYVFLELTCYGQSSTQSEIILNRYLEKYNVKLNSGTLDFYSVAGLNQSGMYSFAVEKLSDESLRKETYKRILKKIALQSELDVTNLFEIYNCKGGADAETVKNFYSNLSSYSGVIKAALKLGDINKSYAQISESKKLITGITKSDFKEMANFTAVLSIIQNSAVVINEANYLKEYYLLLTAASFDIGLQRMQELKTMNCMTDQAFSQALNETVNDLQNFPADFWTKMAITISENQDAASKGVQSFYNIINSGAQLYVQSLNLTTAQALTASSFLGWTSAAVAVISTLKMIHDWNQEWRDITLLGTLYTNLVQKGYSSRHYSELVDFSQFLFLQKMAKCMENSNMVFWEYFKPDQKSVRLYVEGDLGTITDAIVKKRLATQLSCLSDNKKLNASFIGIILDSSGSMTTNDPDDVRKKAAMSIIDQLSGDEFVFIVDFDDKNKWLNENEWKKWNKNDLKDFVSAINSSGGTDVGGGLNAMKQAIIESSSESLPGYVILLTDGLGRYQNEADWFAENNIKVYTVSYKDKADAKLMSHIAKVTNGLYIQAYNENDINIAFSQFFDDLKGYNKYQSYPGNMGGRNKSELPGFFVDNNSSILKGKLNWTSTSLGFSLASPSGKVYFFIPPLTYHNFNDCSSLNFPDFKISGRGPSESFIIDKSNDLGSTSIGDAEWVKGDNYLIVTIQNPEPGEWKSMVSTSDGTNSNEGFLFEASGSSDIRLKLEEKNRGSNFSYLISGVNKSIDLKNSKAEILLTSPSGKNIDISSSYRDGSFSFYPLAGVGNYQISAMIHFFDPNGNPLQRYFVRSKLVGEVLPGYISPVTETMGTYLITDQGTITGNRPGIKCIVFSPGASSSTPKATGVVTHVNEKECSIKIIDMMTGKIEKGDMVELDILQWQNDKK